MRLWHFIVLPPAAMAILVTLARIADPSARLGLTPLQYDVYSVVRGSLISLVMAALIAWLAFRHKREYEAKLRAHNEELKSTRDFLARIIEGSAEAIVTLDPEGNVTSWNRSAERIFGWTAEEMLGRNVERLLPPGDEARQDLERLDTTVRAGQPVRDHEAVRVRKDGETITVRVTRSPIYDADKHYLGSTGIVRDVTALREMQIKLLEAERLAAVGELAASVAHEIKNPLAGIRGACEILSDVFSQDDPRRELTAEVHRQIERLDRTLRDLLLFARPQQLKPELTDIHRVLDGVLAVLLEDALTRGVTVERRYAESLPAVRVDRPQIEQVFVNILLNAFQAMDYRGKVVVATDGDATTVRISVRDAGPGIPEDLAERIFKPFFTTRSKGTGLGLAIVKRIVQAHGGAIAATTAPEGGAVFTVALPIHGV